MTDNEIIKSAECCLQTVTKEDCSKIGCPSYYKTGDCHSCRLYDMSDEDSDYALFYQLITELLDIANRQKAEIERLSNCMMSEEQVREAIKKTIDRDFGKRMLEDYQKLVDSFYEKVTALNCDNYAKAAILNTLRLALHDVQGQDVKSLKAEVIKAFAERLKEHKIDVDVSFGYGKEVYTEAVAVIEIDNLVKEMVGEG